jgi:hypothetical protein
MEKARGVTTDKVALARGAAMDFIMQTEPIVEMGKKTLKEMKEGTKETTAAVISTINTVTTSQQQNVVAGGGGGGQQMGEHDEYMDRTARGL